VLTSASAYILKSLSVKLSKSAAKATDAFRCWRRRLLRSAQHCTGGVIS